MACPKRQAQIAKKKKKADEDEDGESGTDDDRMPRAVSNGGERASMERHFAELGIRDGSEEAEELAGDFGVLALSEDDIGN